MHTLKILVSQFSSFVLNGNTVFVIAGTTVYGPGLLPAPLKLQISAESATVDVAVVLCALTPGQTLTLTFEPSDSGIAGKVMYRYVAAEVS